MFSKGLILASTSRYRRALLAAAGGAVRVRRPRRRRSPPARRTGGRRWPPGWPGSRPRRSPPGTPRAIVIGSDQVALRGTDVLGKPGTVERCREQLRRVVRQGSRLPDRRPRHRRHGRPHRIARRPHGREVPGAVGRRNRPLHRARPAARLRRRLQGRSPSASRCSTGSSRATRPASPASRCPGSAAPFAAHGSRSLSRPGLPVPDAACPGDLPIAGGLPVCARPGAGRCTRGATIGPTGAPRGFSALPRSSCGARALPRVSVSSTAPSSARQRRARQHRLARAGPREPERRRVQEHPLQAVVPAATR